MQKVQIAVPRLRGMALLQWLQEREVVQLTKLDSEQAEARADSDIDRQLAYLQLALEFAQRVREELQLNKKRSWRDAFASKPVATITRLERTLADLDLEEIATYVRGTGDELTKLATRRHELEESVKQLTPWQELDITGADLAGTRHTHHALVKWSLPEDLLVKRRLQEIPGLALHEVGRQVLKKGGTVLAEVVVHRDWVSDFETVLADTTAEAVKLNVPAEVTVRDYLAAQKKRIGDLTDMRQKVLNAAKKYVKLEKRLQYAYDALLHRQARHLASQMGKETAYAVVLSGWVEKRQLATIRQEMDKDFPASAIREVAVADDEVAPVALSNSKVMEPFEAVTNIYGKPRANELDPTVALSLFFLVAFGLALTDAGYGIVMMIATAAAQKYFRLKREARKMVRLLFYAGASTTIFGALTGGWFGLVLEDLPAGEIRDALLSLKIIDPISEPMILLLVSFAIGIVQLLFAWVVRAYDHARQKDYVAVVFDDVAWITMVVVLLAWAGSTRGILPAAWEQPLLYGTLINAGILVLTGGRSFTNPLLKIGGGVLSLYGLVSFLSDTLSYSRLLALGLATGIIALVVNLIGTMVVEAIPVVGWLVAAVVLLGGHIFNLGINTLGAFIHSGRLQFVEFFPKFLEGGGEPFRPFGWAGKYVDNPRDF